MSGLGRTGGFYPGPSRTGGAYPLTQRVLESLEGGRGSAWSTQPGTSVYVENLAMARAIAFDVYEAAMRQSNQFTPWGATVDGLLPRWEVIFGLRPLPSDTQTVRQARLAGAWANMVQTNRLQQLSDDLASACGEAFVEITPQKSPLTGALVYVPWGYDASFFIANAHQSTADVPWYSDCCRVSVQLQVPAGWTLQQFYDAASKVGPIMDAGIRAWETWQWWVANLGPQPPTGFFLDQKNLDWSVFS